MTEPRYFVRLVPRDGVISIMEPVDVEYRNFRAEECAPVSLPSTRRSARGMLLNSAEPLAWTAEIIDGTGRIVERRQAVRGERGWQVERVP